MIKNKYTNGNLTKFQKEYIRKNYEHMSNKDICKELKITHDVLHSYASSSKLTKNIMFRKSKPFYLEKCIEKRNNKEYNVYDYINKDSEKRLSKEYLYKSKFGKYYVNSLYFSNIDNEYKAYWLGFLYADGDVEKHTYKNKKVNVVELCLCGMDCDHLLKFKNSLQSDAPIKKKTMNNQYEANRISICNEHIVDDLISKGCVPQKSLILNFPSENILPKKYIRDFIRGYFDGDGCIHINLDKRSCAFTMVGTYDFLQKVKRILINELDIGDIKLTQKKGTKCYNLAWGDVRAIEKIYNYLYKDCNIYLERKLKKFDTLFCLN